MKKVLIFTDVNFWENCSGNRARIFSLVEYLAPKTRLTVINTGPALNMSEEILSLRFGITSIILEKANYLSAEEYGERCAVRCKHQDFDVLIIEYVHCSYVLNYLELKCSKMLDIHDIVSDRAAEFKNFGYKPLGYELTEKEESAIMNVFDTIITLNDRDYRKVKAMTKNNKVLLCPHAHPICHHAINSRVKTLLFVASSYLPNRDAINFFVEKCWPQIVRKHDVKLKIYGTISDELKHLKHNNIEVCGFEANINLIYEAGDIIINPVRFGAGLKIKNVEALAHGKPLVTTTHGARGLEEISGTGFLVADNENDFVKAIESLISDFELRKTLSQAAIEYANRQFSSKQCFGFLFDRILNS